jgi:integrase
MSARPSRLSKNRHGTFCLRWVVPARYRDATGAPKEVRFSLRTNDPHKARILALEFNLALERMHGMTNDFDLSRMTAPWTLKTDSFAVEVKDDKDQRLFTKFLKENPDIREKLVASIRSGVDPTEALKALLASVKDAIGGAVSAVSQPMHLKEAVRLYVASLPALSKNRGTTVWEKQRSLDQLAEHLQAAGHDVEKIRVHEILRPLILDFIQTYAARKSKEEKRNEKADSEGVARAQQGLDDLKNDIKGAGLSSRTILKKVGNLNDFFTFACGRGWVTSNPIDESFMKSMRQLKIKAGKAKTSNHYDGFKPDDIRKIFDAKDYLDVNRKADYFWGPLISLHTGARLGEIATLTPHRIQYEKEADLHVFLMGRKNENSVRKVPIAQNLIDIGLLDYWQWTLHNDAKFLFPHQPKTETQGETVGKNLTRNFSEYLKKIKIKKDAKVFQSFRAAKLDVTSVAWGTASPGAWCDPAGLEVVAAADCRYPQARVPRRARTPRLARDHLHGHLRPAAR